MWRIGKDVFARLVCHDSAPPYKKIFISVRRGILRERTCRREEEGYNAATWFQCCLRNFLGMPQRCLRSTDTLLFDRDEGGVFKHRYTPSDRDSVAPIDKMDELLNRGHFPFHESVHVAQFTDLYVERKSATKGHTFIGMGQGGIMMSIDEYRNFAACCVEIKAALMDFEEGAVPETPGNFSIFCAAFA